MGEGRLWILDYRKHGAKFPDDFDLFYRQNEEEEKEEVEEAPAKKGKEAAKKADKKGKKGGEPVEEDIEEHQTGSSALVQQFVELVDEYTEMWENNDDSKNFEQKHDVELCRRKVYPIVEARLKQVVDDQMREEIANLKQMYDKSK